jgi:hypothetical protein
MNEQAPKSGLTSDNQTELKRRLITGSPEGSNSGRPQDHCTVQMLQYGSGYRPTPSSV